MTSNTPIALPATVAGVYINLLTGATGTTGASVPGWDFNPYLANSNTQLGFYWNPTPGSPRAAGVAATATGPYLGLAEGSVVSAASTFTSSIIATTGSPFRTDGTHILGVRFFNETAGLTNYGYMSITTNAGSGFPAVINGWSYETSGGSITVVPEPSTALMLSFGTLALGAAQLRRMRRERRQQAH